MKRITLIKHVDHVQLGHLYEHLFCTQLIEHFRSKGLFSYVDYTIDAKTYYAGFIRLEVDLCTDEAVAEEGALQSLAVSFTEDEISSGLLQIMAEKCVDVRDFDKEKMLMKLGEYRTQPWRSLEEVMIYNGVSKRETHEAFTLKPRAMRHFGILHQIISLDPSFAYKVPAVHLPLFAVASRALRVNLQEEIANSSYCYSYDDDFVATHNEVKDINLYRIDKRQATKITDEIETTRELLKGMVDFGFTARLSSFLLHASIAPGMMPDDEEIMKATGMAVGPKGWHKIGTQENIEEILRYATIEFKLGRTSGRIGLESIFKK